MENGNHGADEDESIKPVSSLRSHFERISVPAPYTKDVSRERPHPQGVSTTGILHSTVRDGSFEKATTHLVSSIRPAMTSLATGPIVRSESHTESLSIGSHPFSLPSSGRSSPLPPIRKPLHASSSVSGLGKASATGRFPIVPSAPSIDGAKEAQDSPLISPVVLGNDQLRRTHNLAPPPINRAVKPTIGLKPSSTVVADGPRPSSPFLDPKTSPFTTPPSSDENSPSKESHEQRDEIRSHTSRHVQSGSNTSGANLANSSSYKPGLPSRSKAVESSNLNKQKVATFEPPPRSRGFENPAKLPSRATKPGAAPTIATQSIQQAFSNVIPAGLADGTADQSKVGGLGAKDSRFPTTLNINRRLPYCQAGARAIDVGDDIRLVDISGRHVCTLGHSVKVWDVLTGEMLCSVAQPERDIKATALAFKPAVTSDNEGSRLWLGTNAGDLQEVEITNQMVHHGRGGAHDRREIVKIHRHQNAMWTIDDGGRLCVWPGDDSGLPSLRGKYNSYRIQKGHSCSLIIQDCLWLVVGREIWIYRPENGDSAAFTVLERPLSQTQAGSITCGAVVPSQMDLVYFGHADGKVSVYSISRMECIAVVNVNIYKVSAIVGAGSYLWAAFSVGNISVFDTSTWPWNTRKTWAGHHGQTVLSLTTDRSGLWRSGMLRIVSSGSDSSLRIWDGTLALDWTESYMREREPEYCSFTEISTLVVSWNAGATTPGHLRHEISDPRFFVDVIGRSGFPDVVTFGFQELVDLEDKKLTAKSLFKGSKKNHAADHEHVSHQYRAWRDYLSKCMEDAGRPTDPYRLINTANMVGLFTCTFAKASQGTHIRSVRSAEVKRGMGGLHGNKGAVVVRFMFDDSSFCFVNCHLAAGQTQTSARNNDITAIMESEIFPTNGEAKDDYEAFVDGGDGSMVLDHEICYLNGDLNYRIDTMGRDAVIKAVHSENLAKLLERDQLRVSQRRNPTFALRSLQEAPIAFAPTYKYDVGSTNYDTSDKRRSPAWCDRILHKQSSKIDQLTYQRHELQLSDHRPVSALFKTKVKSISPSKRAAVQSKAEESFQIAKEMLSTQSKLAYLRDVLGVPLAEAQQLVRGGPP